VATADATKIVPKQGRALAAFSLIGWRWISRNPASTIAPILQPFIFLYFLSLITPRSDLSLEILGAMLFTTQNIGGWVLGDSATWRIECSLQDLFVASPMGRYRYLFGIAFSNLMAATPALLVLGALLAYVTPVPWTAWPVIVATLLVLWVLFASVGIALSSRVRTQREIWPINNLLFTLLGMLSPLYFRLSILPGWWQTAAHFLPSTYAALLLQGVVGVTPASPGTLLAYAGLLVLLAGLGLLLAVPLYRWREA
jgi:ABC-type multidrug transport system permease subunit